MNIRKLLALREDKTPVVPMPTHVVRIPVYASPVRTALPTTTWFDVK